MRLKRNLLPLLKPPCRPHSAAAAAATVLRQFSAQIERTQDPTLPSLRLEPEAKTVPHILSLLQTTNPDDWPADAHLRHLLLSASSTSLLKITRQLGSSQKSLLFLNYFKNNHSHSLDASSSSSSSSSRRNGSFNLSFIFQGVLEHATREEGLNSPAKLRELFQFSKEQKVPLSVNSATLLIKFFGQAKMLEEAFDVLDELDPELQNIHLANLILESMIKAGEIDGALKVLDGMLNSDYGFSPNKHTLDILLSTFLTRDWAGRSLRDEEVLRIITRFGERGVFPNSVWLTQLVTKFCRNGKCDKAWDLLHEVMRLGGELKTAPCNALLTGLGKERDFNRMNLLEQEMNEKDIQPDVMTFGILINHLCKFGRVDQALEVFRRMRGGNEGNVVSVEPDVVIYNTLIDGLCKVGRLEEGFKLMDNMMSLKNGCTPNTVTYNTLIDGQCKAGEIEPAFELFTLMNTQGVEPNVITFNTLLDGICRSGQVGKAMDFFDEMQGKGLKANNKTYTILITAFCDANNIDKAMYLFDKMVQSGCSPDAVVYYTLISGLSRSGRMDDAAIVMSKMKEAGFCLDIISYNVLIGGFCKKNELDQAYDLFQEMERAGVKPDRVTYNTMISHFSDKGDFTSARQVLKKMTKAGFVPNIITFGALIKAYCKVGYLYEAMEIYKDMNANSKVSANTVVYNILIDAHCKSGKVEVALSLLQDMKSKRVRPDTTTYNAILKGLQERNWLKKAFNLMDEMTENACNPDHVTMGILNQWLSASGHMKKLRSFILGFKVSPRVL